MTGVSKATATRDLSQMLANGQLRSHGAGKAVRYDVNVPDVGGCMVDLGQPLHYIR